MKNEGVQLSKLLINYATKHIVCKNVNKIWILDISKTFINQLIICIWGLTVYCERNNFCKSSWLLVWLSSTSQWRPHPIWSSSHEEMVSFVKHFWGTLHVNKNEFTITPPNPMRCLWAIARGGGGGGILFLFKHINARCIGHAWTPLTIELGQKQDLKL